MEIFQEIAELFKEHDSFVVLSHVRPDGDALGSQLALGLSLEAMGKTVWFFHEDDVPPNLKFLPGSERIEKPNQKIHPEVVIALDTANRDRLGEKVLASIQGWGKWVTIDHHISNEGYGDVVVVDDSAPATAQIIYELITSQGLPFPDSVRDNLYVAVSTDSGSFRYDSTNSKTYTMAADLVQRGLDVGEVNRLTYEVYSSRRVELLKSLLAGYQLTANGHIADFVLTQAVKDIIDIQPGDGEGLIDIIRGIDTVIVAVFFEEIQEGTIRISMRSKDRKVDVSAACALFGGGGHVLASGAKVKGEIHEVRRQVLEALTRVIDSL